MGLMFSCYQIKMPLKRYFDDNCTFQKMAIKELAKAKFIFNKGIDIIIIDSLYFRNDFSYDYDYILNKEIGRAHV